VAKASLDDPEVVETLCLRIIGGMSVDKACALPDGPSKTLVYQRMASDEAFRTIIARAREAQQHAIVDETVDMADAATPENWQVVRMQIWARQWRAGKLAPKFYGEKITQEVVGADGGPQRVQIEIVGTPPSVESERPRITRTAPSIEVDIVGRPTTDR
jgi:hypothetical protein